MRPPPGPPRVKAEAEEAIPCAGYEGRIIGKGGETIRRLQEESGARISIDRGAGECVVSGTTEQVILGSAAVKKVIAEAGERGGGGGGGGGGGRFVPPSGPFEAEESIACDGSEGRVIGKGGETIRRLQEETGCRIDIEKGSGTCVVKGTAAAVRLGVAAVRRQIEEGDGGPGGFKRKRESEDEPIDSAAMYGQELAAREEDDEPKPPPIEPDFGLSGALAAETNTVNGVTLVYTEPQEAKKPTVRWRLYVFKNGELQGDPIKIHQRSYYLLGRERKVVDIPTDHPSCSKQHAVIQFRARDVMDDDTGDMTQLVTPYILDLDSTNGTHLNGERIDPRKYYQLLEKDTVVFGQSTREFVILNEDST